MARSIDLAIGLAAAALITSGAALLLRPRPSAPTPCTCDDGALRRDVDELRRLVASTRNDAMLRLASRVAVLEAQRDAGGGSNDAPLAASRATPAAMPRFVRWEVPNRAVSIRQVEDGSFAATNTDPALTGQTLIVEGFTAEGEHRPVSIVVPAPGH
jgi:hypothetical protein